MPERTTFDFGGASDHMQARLSWLCACLWPFLKTICCWQGHGVLLACPHSLLVTGACSCLYALLHSVIATDDCQQ